jgi:cell division protein FtsB
MGSDRQDFLERKEARLRRMQQAQQNAAASRSSSKAGKGQAGPGSQAQKAPFPKRKSAEANLAGGASRAQPGASDIAAGRTQTSSNAAAAEQAGQKAGGKLQPAKLAPKPARLSTQQEELSPVGGLTGRRSAARRERQATIRPLHTEPRPSLLARVIVWGTMAICALLILATLGEAWTVHQLHQQVNASQQAANQLQNQNRTLATQIAQLQQTETIENEARQLGYIYPGDQPVVVVTAQPAAPTMQQQSGQPPTKDWWGFWPDWLKVFFGG